MITAPPPHPTPDYPSPHQASLSLKSLLLPLNEIREDQRAEQSRLQGQKPNPRAALETGAVTQGVGNSQLELPSEHRGVQGPVVSSGAGAPGLVLPVQPSGPCSFPACLPASPKKSHPSAPMLFFR